MSEVNNTTNNKSEDIMTTGKILVGVNSKCNPGLASRFRGCMLGALLGDCLGQPFDGEERPISKSVLNSYFEKLHDSNLKAPFKAYSDDSAMTFSVAQSLINKNRFDPHDMARKFVDEFYAHPRRGYASSITDVFRALKREDCKDPYGPGRLLYAGRGSYGNGSAMRIAPVALFCHSNAEEAMNIAYKSSLITHANELGYNGAILQCLAIHKALHLDSSTPLDVDQFAAYLLEKMSAIEKTDEQQLPTSGSMNSLLAGQQAQPRITKLNMTKSSYVRKLQEMRHLLKSSSVVSAERVVDVLGHFVSAYGSVCTAIYSFLRCAKDDASSSASGNNNESPVQRAIRYAISLGGDTDTIASMTGALAGAYYGHEAVPQTLLSHCEAEGVQTATTLADCLYQTVEK